MSPGTEATRELVRAYHEAWTSGDHDAFQRLLGEDVEMAFPIPIAWPEGTSVTLLWEIVDADQAVQIYDAKSPAGAVVRVAEHVTVRDGRVCRIGPVFDVATMRRFMAGG